MTQLIYNTLTRTKEELAPKKKNQLNLFVCGVTVYDFTHLGHARCYIAYDTIVKYLRSKGMKVHYLQNVTDIDDKIIDRANEKGIDPLELAKHFEEECLKDMTALRVNSVDVYARATEYMEQIISQVQRLMDKGFAYELDDGVYFDVEKYEDYGQLTNQKLEDLKEGSKNKTNKKHFADFALWKKQKPGEPAWESPWGKGRPGWHIEDTAIAEHFYGDQYDMHGGGNDLIFPHHEAEIAQMEAISGKKPYVKYWIHNGFVTINEEKMSKSLDNFKTIRATLEQYSWQTLRYFLATTHYRAPINFTDQALDGAKNSVQRIHESVRNLQNYTENGKTTLDKELKATKEEFTKHMDNDFETAPTIAAIFNLVRDINTNIANNALSQKGKEAILKQFKEWNEIFEFLIPEDNIPKEVMLLAAERQEAREQKDFKRSDEIRDKIKEMGYYVDDTKDGFQVKPL